MPSLTGIIMVPMSDPIQIGDFRIERQIGAGGMGVVYLTTQVSLNRKVTLNVLGHRHPVMRIPTRKDRNGCE